MVCARCGTANGDEKYFCKHCGFNLQGRRRPRAWLIACPPPIPDLAAVAARGEDSPELPTRSLVFLGIIAAGIILAVLTALIETIRRVRAPFDAPGVAAFVETNPLDTAATWVYHNPALSYMIAGVVSLIIAGIFVEFWR